MLHIHNHLLQSLHKTPQENMGWIHTDDAEDDIHFLGHYLSGHEDKDHMWTANFDFTASEPSKF